MVTRITLLLLVLGLTTAVAPAGEPPPAAKDLLPPASALPGAYGHPWKIGGDTRLYKTESSWREAHPNRLQEVRSLPSQFSQIPANAWAEMRARLEEQATPFGGDFAAMAAVSGTPAQGPALQAMSTSETVQAAIQAIQARYAGLEDAACTEYVKIQRPKRLQATEEKKADPGGLSRIRVDVLVYSEEWMTANAAVVDLDAKELETLQANTRAGLEEILVQLIDAVTGPLEEDLAEQYESPTPDQAKIDALLEKLSAYADVEVQVRGVPLMPGDASHALFLWRGALPGQPRLLQGTAQLRRGRAVVQASFEVTAPFMDDFEAELQTLFRFMEKAAAPYRME